MPRPAWAWPWGAARFWSPENSTPSRPSLPSAPLASLSTSPAPRVAGGAQHGGRSMRQALADAPSKPCAAGTLSSASPPPPYASTDHLLCRVRPLCQRSRDAPPTVASTPWRHLAVALTAATARAPYKSTTPRPPEHLTHLLASPRLSPAPIVARRTPQLRRPICPSRLGCGQILRQRGTVRRFPPPRASSDHRDADEIGRAHV